MYARKEASGLYVADDLVTQEFGRLRRGRLQGLFVECDDERLERIAWQNVEASLDEPLPEGDDWEFVPLGPESADMAAGFSQEGLLGYISEWVLNTDLDIANWAKRHTNHYFSNPLKDYHELDAELMKEEGMQKNTTEGIRSQFRIQIESKCLAPVGFFKLGHFGNYEEAQKFNQACRHGYLKHWDFWGRHYTRHELVEGYLRNVPLHTAAVQWHRDPYFNY